MLKWSVNLSSICSGCSTLLLFLSNRQMNILLALGNWGFGTAPLIFQDDFLLWFYYKVLGPPRSTLPSLGFLVLLPWYPLLRTTQTFGWVTKFAPLTSVMGWLWKHLGFCGSIPRIIISLHRPDAGLTMFCTSFWLKAHNQSLIKDHWRPHIESINPCNLNWRWRIWRLHSGEWCWRMKDGRD